jgi:hypothetical protein
VHPNPPPPEAPIPRLTNEDLARMAHRVQLTDAIMGHEIEIRRLRRELAAIPY